MNGLDSPRTDGFLWGVIALWVTVTLTSFLAPAVLSPNHARYVNVALLSLFTLVHGAGRYGWTGIGVYFVVGVVVANVFENLSVMTGFPFGHYHHTAAMGPQVFHVPVIVGPIFAVAGYIAWAVAGVLLGEVFGPPAAGLRWARAWAAAFITSSWDLCVDAIGGTVNRDWVWADGGAFFGVPWQNFAGWVLTMVVIFTVFSAYVARSGAARAVDIHGAYWLQPIVFWLLIGLQFPLLAALVPDATITDPSGQAWALRGIFVAMAIVSVFTMIFSAGLAWVLLARARRKA